MSITAQENIDLFDNNRIPKTGEDFERLTKIACSKKFKRAFSFYGRSGQKQHGIDLYSDHYEICIQCKNYPSGDAVKKLCDEFKKDIAVAYNKFCNTMQTYIFATTAKRDTRIQDAIEMSRLQYPNLQIHVLFREDFEDLFREYPDIIPEYNRQVSIPIIEPHLSLHLRDVYDSFVAQDITDLSLEEFVESLIPTDTLAYLLTNGCSITAIAEGHIPINLQKKLETTFKHTLDYYGLRCFIGKARSFLDCHSINFEELRKVGLSFLDGDAKNFFALQTETGMPQKILAVLVLYAIFHPTVFLALRPHIVNAWKNI